MTHALQIRDAVIALLTTPALPAIGSDGVTGEIVYPTDTSGFPRVEVWLGDEQNETCLVTTIDHVTELNITIKAEGNDPLAAADALVAEAYHRLMDDPTGLGGLIEEINPQGIKREYDALVSPVAAVTLMFSVTYNTPSGIL